MNKGFLTFSDEEPGLTMLKDEVDDLTHLAPVAGDVSVPLEQHPFLMFDDFLLRDNFDSLLVNEPADPFMAYRDYHDPSPQLLSPNLSKNSDCSLPSLNSPCDSLADEDQMSTFISLQMDDDPELSMKAPYIPMGDDLPLLMQGDLMWSNVARDKTIPDNNSSLAQLLSSSVNKHTLKSNDHGGGLLQEDVVLDETYNEKNSLKWKSSKSPNRAGLERTPSTKRSNSTIYDTANKRTKSEPKEKLSSELLQQLISNNHHNKGRPKGKSNWLLESNIQKAACISQPSDSVLMNLLENPLEPGKDKRTSEWLTQKRTDNAKVKDEGETLSCRNMIRKKSISLLDPEATAIASLLDLTQQDFDVNAPVHSYLLQGHDLLMALDTNTPI